jgi:hypothetical protein
MTPLAAVVGGLLAGVVGTVCMDAVWYIRHRRDGGKKSPLEWEFGPVDSWEDAPGYVVLPEGGIYKPIWEYDAKTLARDLSAHLAYGTGPGAAFWLFAKLW